MLFSVANSTVFQKNIIPRDTYMDTKHFDNENEKSFVRICVPLCLCYMCPFIKTFNQVS
jgi:hypothetical protein